MSPPDYPWHTTQHRLLIFHSHGWGLYSFQRWLLYGCAAPRRSHAITRRDTSFQCLGVDWFTLPILLLVHTPSFHLHFKHTHTQTQTLPPWRVFTLVTHTTWEQQEKKSIVSSFRQLIGIVICAIMCMHEQGSQIPNSSFQMFPPL